MMKQFLLFLILFLALTARASATDIDIGASSITGFNSANASADTPLSNVSVTLGSASVTCSNCLPQSAVGLSGMKITLAGVVYDIASVASRSAFTLTANYAASTGTVSGTLHKFVHLRLYVLTPFVPAGSTTVVQSGSPGTTAWYRRYAVSVINDGAQNVAHVPQINDLPATTDSSNPTARYYAALYTQAGGFMHSYPGCVDDFRLSHQTTPTSWAQICSFNSVPPSPPSQPLNFYTAAQIDARLPSCLINNLDFFAATGNVKSCLTLSADFSITGSTLSVVNPLKQIQEEGSNLPIRNFLNFVGASFTAADDAGNARTNVTADSDLDALASNSTNGFWARTGAGTGAARTLLGTTNRITVTGGDGSANPVFDIGSTVATSGNSLNFFAATTSAQLAGVISDETGSGALVFGTSPAIGTPTLTSPRVVTAINDANGNSLFDLTATGSAVNRFAVANAVTGGRPKLSTTGGDTNIGLELAASGTGTIFTSNRVDIFRANDSSAFLLLSNNTSPKNWALTPTNGGDFVIGEFGVANAITMAHTTGVATLSAIPILPASNPTTANQATRKQYVDDRQVSFSASFFILDPSVGSLSSIDYGAVIIPGGGEYTITKCKIARVGGSHTAGGSVSFVIQQQGVGTKCTVTFNDTNNAVNTVYTDDVGDFTVAENVILGALISARSGTITERNVTITVEGFRKVF